jgi:hypothetical protein
MFWKLNAWTKAIRRKRKFDPLKQKKKKKVCTRTPNA